MRRLDMADDIESRQRDQGDSRRKPEPGIGRMPGDKLPEQIPDKVPDRDRMPDKEEGRDTPEVDPRKGSKGSMS
ncbi:MAG: hypothetical protein ACT4P5_07430 [Armatimonadota bacterium]